MKDEFRDTPLLSSFILPPSSLDSMFERRLKIFLAILVAVTVMLALRAGQVQVWQKAHWQAKADEIGRDSHPIETIRGKILDVKGRELAIDRPCIDACIDFQAIVR